MENVMVLHETVNTERFSADGLYPSEELALMPLICEKIDCFPYPFFAFSDDEEEEDEDDPEEEDNFDDLEDDFEDDFEDDDFEDEDDDFEDEEDDYDYEEDVDYDDFDE
jgi:hypothetical protein